MKKLFSVILAVFLLVSSFTLIGQAAEGGLMIENLKTDNMVMPLGIDSAAPVFSWNLSDEDTRGQKQTAYRITVSESQEALNSGAFVWDSGKVSSDETANIAYDGTALEPSTRYFWRVEVWDKDGKSVTSETSWFETGLMDSGWSDAEWIRMSDAIGTGYFDMTKFSVEMDYAVTNTCASLIFGAKGTGDFYMWQLGVVSWNNGFVMRPHTCTNGSFKDLATVAMESDQTNVGNKMTLKIEVSDGVIKTYHNGDLKDTRTFDAFDLGYLGFRKAGTEYSEIYNIKVMDENGVVVYEEDFEEDNGNYTGLISSGGALLINADTTAGVYLRTEDGEAKAESAPMLRKEFSTADGKTVKNARLYITSAGIYRAYINGVNVTDSYLNPGMTAYDDHIMYQTYDVTDLIADGDNAIGAYLGHGWWNRALRNFGPNLYLYAKLLVEYDDGTSDVIVTDDSWMCYRYGPIIDDDIFNGFKFDGTVEEAMDGWNKPGYDEAGWDPVTVAAANKIVSNGKTPNIIAQNIPLIKNTITLEPISVTEPKEGVYVYDFGQNIAGIVRITATAPKGTTVTLRHAEMINLENMTGADDDPGMIYTANLPRALNTDTYVFKGNPDGETFEPFFTYHGFRYLEITGLDEPLPVEDVAALLLMTDLEQTGTFDSSNALVNRLYLNSLWSARDNFMSVPTDCPQRGERFGWTGDAQIFARTGSYMMDVNAFYQKYCMDMRDTSTDNRIIADVSPASVGNGWYGSGDRTGATNGWGDAIIIIPYQIYKQYGNKQILEENYETMCNWMDYLVSTSTDYIRDESWTGDWLPINEPKTPIAVTDTAFCAYSALLLSEIAEELGLAEDAATYAELYNNYRNAWRTSFLKEDGYTTVCGTQTSYVLAIQFGLIDDDKLPNAAENLVKNIKSWDWHLTTGFLGLSYLNPVLSDSGYTEAAFRLLEQEEYPSWLYSVTTGSTTIWESWSAFRLYEDGSSKATDDSLNHFSYGAVSEWLYRYMLGIERDDENSNSFKHFLLKPEFGGSFTYANGSYDSIRGTIKSGWALDKETGAFTYSAVVPANTTATLYLPVLSADTAVTESGVSAESSEGVTLAGYEDGHAVFELASGSYEFTTTVDTRMNDISSVKISNTQGVDAAVTIDGEEYTKFPANAVVAFPELTVNVACNEAGYVFSHFEDADGNRYENNAAFSGDMNLDMIFAYTGTDDGEDDKKTVTITGDSAASITVNGEEQALPYTGEFEKGELVVIDVTVDIFAKEFSDLGGIKGKGGTVYLKPYEDITANVNIRDERFRTGYDIFFDFTDNIDLWRGSNANVAYEPGYMRFEAVQKTDGSFDPRAYYDFTENTTTPTGGEYVPADMYESLVIGFIADEVAGDSAPYMYISTEALPSYINPVRGRKANSSITTDMADGKTLREVTFTLSDWSAWTGNIKQVYLDILDNVDGSLRVDYIKFKHRDLKLTVKNGVADTGTVYTYIPGSTVDLTAFETGEDFLGYSLQADSADYITSLELTEDTTVYANYKEFKYTGYEWSFDDNTMQDWTVEATTDYGVTDGVLKVSYLSAYSDVKLIKGGLNAAAEDYSYVVVDLRHNVPEGLNGSKPFEVFYKKTGGSWGQHLCVNTTLLPASDSFDRYILNLSSDTDYSGTVEYLRIDPFEAAPPNDGDYYYEIDRIMYLPEANIVLDYGYDGAEAETIGVPALIPVKLSDYASPEREGYSFVGWTDGVSDEIITEVTLEKDMMLYAKWIPENYVWDFENGSTDGWYVTNATDHGITDGVWKVGFLTTTGDAWIRNESLNIPASGYRYVAVDIRHNVPSGSFGSKPFEVFFIRTGDTPWQQHLSANITQSASDGSTFTTYVVDMNKSSYWSGTLERLRIDPFEIKSASSTEYYFEIDKISLCYEVKLTLNDGTTTKSYSLPAGVATDLSQYTKPEKEGYVFMGWAYGEDGDTIDAVTLSEDTILYAVWSKTGAALKLTDEAVKVTANGSAALVVTSNDADGRVLDTVIKPVDGSCELTLAELGLDTTGAATVKAFLFDSAEGLNPLCASREIQV